MPTFSGQPLSWISDRRKDGFSMMDISANSKGDKQHQHAGHVETTTALEAGPSITSDATLEEHGPIQQVATASTEPEFKSYKRRWFGIATLMAMNIAASWGWLTFAPVSSESAEYFKISETAINWLSIVVMLATAVANPAVVFILNRKGPKIAIIVAAVLLVLGNWLRVVGTRVASGSYAAAMVGQVLIGLAQAFVLSSPTHYSDLWFSSRGRVSATALASLANPFGAAVGQLVNPFLATKASDIPNMVLYIAIISTVLGLPGVFIPRGPPTPPCKSSAQEKLQLRLAIKALIRNKNYWFIMIMFSVYVGTFNAFTSVINQVMEPYGYSTDDAGICAAVMIAVGLVAAGIISPIIDKYHGFLWAVRIQVPIIALSYLAFIWAPTKSHQLAGPYVLAALLGASSFSLMPIALEYVIEQTHPVSPEITSASLWVGGQILGVVFLLIMDTLKAGPSSDPPKSMRNSMIFQATVALVVAPLSFFLGRGTASINRRVAIDQGQVIEFTKRPDGTI